jgi:glycine cleavage system aminomethyltransferase T
VSQSGLQRYFESRRVPAAALGPGVTAPQRFIDPAAEHLATRNAAGLFDFSFMGCVEIAGEQAGDYLDYLQTRNLAGLKPGRIAYTRSFTKTEVS